MSKKEVWWVTEDYELRRQKGRGKTETLLTSVQRVRDATEEEGEGLLAFEGITADNRTATIALDYENIDNDRVAEVVREDMVQKGGTMFDFRGL
jgi:hypothetical protein